MSGRQTLFSSHIYIFFFLTIHKRRPDFWKIRPLFISLMSFWNTIWNWVSEKLEIYVEDALENSLRLMTLWDSFKIARSMFQIGVVINALKLILRYYSINGILMWEIITVNKLFSKIFYVENCYKNKYISTRNSDMQSGLKITHYVTF